MFIVNMKAPGVEIRPIKQASGKSGFNEVYFTDVRIKDDHRLGAVGDGWKVSIVTLMNERLAVGSASGPDAKEMLALAQSLEVDDRPALENKAVRDRIATWHCEQSGLHFTKLRVQSAMSRGETPGPENSITKIVSANKLQGVAATAWTSWTWTASWWTRTARTMLLRRLAERSGAPHRRGHG